MSFWANHGVYRKKDKCRHYLKKGESYLNLLLSKSHFALLNRGPSEVFIYTEYNSFKKSPIL